MDNIEKSSPKSEEGEVVLLLQIVPHSEWPSLSGDPNESGDLGPLRLITNEIVLTGMYYVQKQVPFANVGRDSKHADGTTFSRMRRRLWD